MTDLVLTVGLPGSGKSTWVREFEIEHADEDWITIESDEYRLRLFADEQGKDVNVRLFKIIHEDIYNALSSGKSVVFDATSLSYKYRKSLLDRVSKLDVYKICILFATAYDICLERNKNRDRKVPEEIIKRMRENFNTPMYDEGWDYIEVVCDYNPENYSVDKYLEIADKFDQDNPNHSMTLGEHSRKVIEYMVEENNLDEHILLAGLLHDVGKPDTKVFHNMKGEVTDISHYYNHENVGAYESIFYLDQMVTRTKDLLFASALINHHMRFYNLKTEKAKKKLLDTVGEDLYYFLEILNLADKKAH